jgi:hypothetical protein
MLNYSQNKLRWFAKQIFLQKISESGFAQQNISLEKLAVAV